MQGGEAVAKAARHSPVLEAAGRSLLGKIDCATRTSVDLHVGFERQQSLTRRPPRHLIVSTGLDNNAELAHLSGLAR